MRLLLIEDDDHKVNDVINLIKNISADISIKHHGSVREGVIDLLECQYDLLILDMALPTFEKTKYASGGASQPMGGIELIRTINMSNEKTKVVILTQYPDIELDGIFIPISECADVLSARYDCDIIGAVIYKNEETLWADTLSGFIRGAL